MNERITKIRVGLHFSEEKAFDVGEIIQQNRALYFKYHPDFLRKGIQLSPFKLPLTTAVIPMSTFPFEGLAGLFNDSLPDGWGRLLLDRMLTTKGIHIHEISLLDRLAYVGKHGIGALTYIPTHETNSQE